MEGKVKKISVEQASLANIITGFNEQSIGMPSIFLRYLELEGELTTEEAEEAFTLYEKTIESIMGGHNLTVTQLAAYYIMSELVLQRKEAMVQLLQTVASADKVEPEDVTGYA